MGPGQGWHLDGDEVKRVSAPAELDSQGSGGGVMPQHLSCRVKEQELALMRGGGGAGVLQNPVRGRGAQRGDVTREMSLLQEVGQDRAGRVGDAMEELLQFGLRVAAHVPGNQLDTPCAHQWGRQGRGGGAGVGPSCRAATGPV